VVAIPEHDFCIVNEGALGGAHPVEVTKERLFDGKMADGKPFILIGIEKASTCFP
jgi:hypothetical protein